MVEAQEKPQKLTVETSDNHIYFYSHVDSDRTLALIKAVRDADIALRSQSLSRGLGGIVIPIPIYIHIQSGGGSLLAAFAVADQLAAIKSPVYSIVEGYAASAATIISTACHKRFIVPSAFMMIHQFWSFFWGTYEEFKDEARFQEMAMQRLVDHYVGHTKMKESRVRAFLKRDSWFSASECVRWRLVDAIVEG